MVLPVPLFSPALRCSLCQNTRRVSGPRLLLGVYEPRCKFYTAYLRQLCLHFCVFLSFWRQRLRAFAVPYTPFFKNVLPHSFVSYAAYTRRVSGPRLWLRVYESRCKFYTACLRQLCSPFCIFPSFWRTAFTRLGGPLHPFFLKHAFALLSMVIRFGRRVGTATFYFYLYCRLWLFMWYPSPTPVLPIAARSFCTRSFVPRTTHTHAAFAPCLLGKALPWFSPCFCPYLCLISAFQARSVRAL
jgi:hypothetical protein